MNDSPIHHLDNYQNQLDIKVQNFRQAFKDASLEVSDISVYDSEPLGFRMRAEFRICHQDGTAQYAMNKPGEKHPYTIDSFPIGSALINHLMPPILEAINASDVLSRKLFNIEFLTTLSNEALVTLIYHRQLDSQWQIEARKLQSALNIKIIGRSRKQKVVLDKDYVTERLTVDNRE